MTTQIADLNCYCILEIVERLSFGDLKNISEVSKYFYEQTKFLIKKKSNFRVPSNWLENLPDKFQRDYENLQFSGRNQTHWIFFVFLQQFKRLNFDTIKAIEIELWNIRLLQKFTWMYTNLEIVDFLYNSRYLSDQQEVFEMNVIDERKAKCFIKKATIYVFNNFETSLNNIEMPNLQELTLVNGNRNATTNLRLDRFSYLKKLKVLNLWPPNLRPIDSLSNDCIRSVLLENIDEITCALCVDSVINILELLLDENFGKPKLFNIYTCDFDRRARNFLETRIRQFENKIKEKESEWDSFSNVLELKVGLDQVYCTYVQFV